MSRKIYLFVIIGCLLCMERLFSSCGLASQLSRESEEMREHNLKASEALLECFERKDRDALKNLLCEKTRALEDINEQIEAAFALFEGEVVSFDRDDIEGPEERSKENGVLTKHSLQWSICEIKMDTGSRYTISVNKYRVNKEDSEKEGITELVLTGEKGEEAAVGYRWRDYYKEGAQTACEIIVAFSEKDRNKLRELLSEKVLGQKETEGQLQSSMEFFEGAALGGKMETLFGKEYYDGSKDYRVQVREEERIQNREAVSVKLTVQVENIRTDDEKTYTLYFCEYILCEGYKELKGVNSVVLMREDRSGEEEEKTVIGKELKKFS